MSSCFFCRKNNKVDSTQTEDESYRVEEKIWSTDEPILPTPSIPASVFRVVTSKSGRVWHLPYGCSAHEVYQAFNDYRVDC